MVDIFKSQSVKNGIGLVSAILVVGLAIWSISDALEKRGNCSGYICQLVKRAEQK